MQFSAATDLRKLNRSNLPDDISERPTRFVGHLTITAQKGEWFAGILESDGYGPVNMTGITATPLDHQRIRVEGTWQTHPRFGEQLQCRFISLEDPSKAESLWLTSGILVGVKDVIAARILAHFDGQGSIFDHMTESELQQVKGIGPVNVKKIMASWAKVQHVARASAYGMGVGLSLAQSKGAYDIWGDSMREVIEQRPYDLTMVDGISFEQADKIAQGLGHPLDAPDRIIAGTVEVLRRATVSGHTCLPTRPHPVYPEAVWPELVKLLGENTSRDQWKALTLDLAESDDRRVEVIKDTQQGIVFLADRVLYLKERAIAEDVRRLLAGKVQRPILTEKHIDELAGGLILAEQQREAIRLAAKSPVMILTGGPGTGKTTVLRVVVKLFRDMAGLSILCMAPTGKAAVRMAQATGAEAGTIHRMLGIKGAGAAFGHDSPLPEDVVIVDESSMIDTNLAAAVFAAVKTGARLILVGDADQLPPVGPGQVFRSLIDAGHVPAVRLTQVHRQAAESGIIVNAHRLNNGEPLVLNGYRDVAWLTETDRETMVGRAVHIVCERLPEMGIGVEDVTVLAPYRKQVDELNRQLQDRLNLNERRQFGKRLFLSEGDPVRHTKNNYTLNVFNGETGRITHIMSDAEIADWNAQYSAWDSQPPIVTVEYPDRTVCYPREFVPQLTLAYAITIHSSQGSEYKCIVLLVPVCGESFMKRELPYTGLTRAKELAVLIGDPAALAIYEKAQSRAYRHTQLPAFLNNGQH